ncbi:MAG: tetratricopeptide repeat protein [Verrucomicrobiae bacterium]|nr:tetratricopeptide repeat protein [Verrucomicrobiae bacterium]
MRHWIFLVAFVGLIAGSPLAQQPAETEQKSPTQLAFEKGVELYEAGKFEEALKVFQEFGPGRQYSLSVLAANAIYFEGWCLLALKRPEDAIKRFQLIIEKFADRPVAPEAMLKLAETYRDLKQMDKALATYRNFQKKFPEHNLLPQAILGEAWVLFRTGDNANAKALSARVYREYSANMTALLDSLFLLGQIYTEEKNFEEARKVYEELKKLRKNPRASEALFLAAESLYNNAEKLKTGGQPEAATKNFLEAIQYYEQVRSRDSLVEDIRREIAGIRRILARVPRERREALLREIDDLQKLSANIAQQTDLRPIALFRIANAYQSIDRPEEASLVYQHFLRIYRESHKELAAQAHFGLIQTLNLRGQPEKAKKATEEFEQQFPEMKGKDLVLYARFLKGDSEFKTGQFKEALASFQDFLRNSNNPELNETAEFYIAACHFALEDFIAARDTFARFIEKYPRSQLLADAQFRLGRSYYELSRPERGADKAVQQANLTKAVEILETVRREARKAELLPETVFQLGYLYTYLGEFDSNHYRKSAEMFGEFAAKWPDHTLAPEAMYQRAQALSALRQHDDAITTLRELVSKHPNHALAPWAAYGIGAAHAAANRPDEMIAAFRAYVKQYPTHERAAEALYAIGQSYENRGKLDEAITAYRDVVQFALDAPEKTLAVVNPATAAQVQIANILVRQRRFDDAIVACEGFLEQFASHPVAVRAIVSQMAAMYRGAKEIPKGQNRFTELLNKYQEVAEVRIALNTALVDLAMAAEDWAAAYAAALKLQLDPQRDRLPAASYISMGTAFLRSGHPARARDAFTQMLQAHPEDLRNVPVALVGLGNALWELNEPAEAEKQYRRVIAEHSRHAAVLGAHLGMGRILEERGQLDDAIREYEAARVPRSDTELEASFRIARILHLKKNDCRAALPLYARLLLANSPFSEEAAFRTAQTHRCICLEGERSACEVARRSYQSYLNRFKDRGKFLKEAAEELASIPPPPPPPGQ